jgi:hypothetical protein
VIVAVLVMAVPVVFVRVLAHARLRPVRLDRGGDSGRLF